MNDQGNQNMGGQQDPLAGGQGAPVPPVPVPPTGGVPTPPVPPAPVPAAPVPPAPVPTAPVPPAPVPAAPSPVSPVPPAPMPAPVASVTPAVPPVPAPAPVTPAPAPMPTPAPAAPAAPAVSAPATPAAPAKPAAPKKPMTLEDLAKQTPIFSDDELAEDDFDPWAPLDDAKKDAGSLDEKEEEIAEEEALDEDAKEEEYDLKVDEKELEPKKEEPKKPEPKPAEVEKPKVEEPAPELASDEPEIIEGSLVGEDDIDPFEGIDGEDEENPLTNLLKQVNLDAKKIVGCIVIFVMMILLIIGMIFGGKFLLNKLAENKVEVVKEEVVEKVEVVKKEVEEVVEKVEKVTVVEEAEKIIEETTTEVPAGWIDPSLYTGVRVGMQAAEGEPDASEDTSSEDTSSEDTSDDMLSDISDDENIVRYVGILADIRGVYETDIQLMLNKSNDRNRTLGDFIAQMKSLSLDAHGALKEIADRKAALGEEFDAVTTQKQLHEDAYFSNLSANNPIETNDNLVRFTELARLSVDIRARYRALDKVEEYMQRFVSALDTRIRDVDFNREALIKGVKVIDVEGSNIELIIPETDL